MENNSNDYNNHRNNNISNSDDKTKVINILNIITGVFAVLRMIFFGYYVKLVGRDLFNSLNSGNPAIQEHNVVKYIYYFTIIAMLVLGIILIVLHKKGKNKGITLSNGIVAIIPFANIACIVLSIVSVAKADNRNTQNQNNSVENTNN